MDQISNKNESAKFKSEQWKYTNANSFSDFSLKFNPKHTNVNQECKPNEIIIYNGQVAKCGEYVKKNGIQIYNTQNAFKKNINNFKEIFNTIAPKEQDQYFSYNTENYNSGYYLYIPKNFSSNHIILIKNIIDQGNENSFLNYRNFIYCDENVKATILNEEIFSINHCINIVCETYLKKNTRLEIINYSEKPQTKQIYNFSAYIDENSNLDYHSIDISGNLLKNNYYFNLEKPGSTCLFNGFNIANDKAHNDSYIQINHNSPYTISDINYKIIANQTAQSILFAKSTINKGSHHSEAYQKNNNLILSDKAIIHSNPQLEIYNDDVKCSHGSATGQFDDEAIYYMRTRGINEKMAKELILNSFINEIIERISPLDIQKNLRNKTEKYLKNGH